MNRPPIPNAKVAEEFWVPTKGGKMHPLYAGVLDAAFKEGLQEINVIMLQEPLPENGHLAIVQATVKFEDGRKFTELGDAGPQNCAPHMAVHSCRLAATRAKGRALRDALNLGVPLKEELFDDVSDASPEAQPDRRERVKEVLEARERPLPLAPVPPIMECAICHKVLLKAQYELSMRNYSAALCPAHQPKSAQRQGF